MTTATKITPTEFLAMDPHDHPDFVLGGDPRRMDSTKTGRKDQTLFMPNLVALIQKIGGPDVIPDQPEQWFAVGDPRFGVEERENGGFLGDVALLKDLHSGRIYAQFSRWDASLCVERWHPKNDSLEINLAIPADWSVSA